MIIRQLTPSDYDRLYEKLVKKAYSLPLDAAYSVTLQINKQEYSVKLQPERDNNMAVLQALRVERDEWGADFELITENRLLSSFLDLLLEHGVA